MFHNFANDLLRGCRTLEFTTPHDYKRIHCQLPETVWDSAFCRLMEDVLQVLCALREMIPHRAEASHNIKDWLWTQHLCWPLLRI